MKVLKGGTLAELSQLQSQGDPNCSWPAPTWGDGTELIFAAQKQVPWEFPGVSLLWSRRWWTQREAAPEKGLLLHGVGTGRLLKGTRMGHMVRPHLRPRGVFQCVHREINREQTRGPKVSGGKLAGGTRRRLGPACFILGHMIHGPS